MEELTSAILKNVYPFNRCGASFRMHAFSMGNVRSFPAGSHIRNGNEKNKEFGLILDGEAISFETDVEHNRYRLSLTPGCWFGLELLEPSDEKPLSKINALSDVTVLVWDRDDFDFLCADLRSFEKSLYRLKKGGEFQQASLIPLTDTTDPVLMLIRPHWILPALKCAAVIACLCIALELLSKVTGQNQASLTMMILCSLGAGWGLYTIIRRWLNEQWIITSHNLICFSPDTPKEADVIPLSMMDQCDVKSFLFGVGTVKLKTYEKEITSFLMEKADAAGALLQSACYALPNRIDLFRENPVKTDEGDESGTKRLVLEYRTHKIVLWKQLHFPVIVLFILLGLFNRIERTLLYWILLNGVAWWVWYRFYDWYNDRFYIEEDCVRSVQRKPFTKETVNITMLDNIQSARFEKKGLLQIFLNYGTLYIVAGKGELTYLHIPNPEKKQRLVQNACSRYKMFKAQAEEQQRLDYVENLLKAIRENSNNGSSI